MCVYDYICIYLYTYILYIMLHKAHKYKTFVNLSIYLSTNRPIYLYHLYAAGLMLARNRQNSIQDCKRPPARINRKINVYEWMYIVYIYTYVYVCMHACMYVCMYQCINVYCVHIISIYIYMYTYTYTYIRFNLCMHVFGRTPTRNRRTNPVAVQPSIVANFGTRIAHEMPNNAWRRPCEKINQFFWLVVSTIMGL